MSREQAVPKVNGRVINVSNVSVTFPVPDDDIARGQAAQRRHLGGQARPDRSVDKPGGPGFPVGYIPGWNVKSAPLLV